MVVKQEHLWGHRGRVLRRSTGRKRSNMLRKILDLASMHAAGCPRILLHLVLSIHLSPLFPPLGHPDLDAVEFFAGAQAWTYRMRSEGFSVLPYDLAINAEMNMCSCFGLALATYLACKVKRGGICFFAPVCSSWTFMARSSSGRSLVDAIGDTSRAFVANGNLMATRCLALILLLQSRGVSWCIEQPSSSILHMLPRFQSLLRSGQIVAWTLRFNMEDFGGDTKKPTVLYASADWFGKLTAWKVDAPVRNGVNLVTSYVDKLGKKRCTGNSNLKLSQHYPRQFGEAFAKMFKASHLRYRSVEQVQCV